MKMVKTEYKQKQNALFKKWKRARPEYEAEGKCFPIDGIADFDKWLEAKPKILFLLKEIYCDPKEWEPHHGITSGSNIFSKNIARWHVILQTLFKDPSKKLSFTDICLPPTIEDVALVELKKANEGCTTSSYKDIAEYAARDKEFLKEQIDIIQPEVIFCCGTGDFYGDILYGDEPWEQIAVSAQVSWSKHPNKKCYCFKHRDRLVIDFYHPSARGHNEELFSILCDLVRRGRVFEKFDWGNLVAPRTMARVSGSGRGSESKRKSGEKNPLPVE
jgi:hypothetical protein